MPMPIPFSEYTTLVLNVQPCFVTVKPIAASTANGLIVST
jgi:hypothetical protein